MMLQAWTGEPFDWRGRTSSSRPSQSSQAAPHDASWVGECPRRRAGRASAAADAADEHRPESCRDAYFDEGKKIGYKGASSSRPSGPRSCTSPKTPSAAWAEIGPYVLYETQTYASYQTPGQHSMPVVHADDLDGLRTATATLWVDTPDGILARLADASTGSGPTVHALNFHPLAGGLPPDLAWASLELFAAQVLPKINALTPSIARRT